MLCFEIFENGKTIDKKKKIKHVKIKNEKGRKTGGKTGEEKGGGGGAEFEENTQ